MTDFEIKYAPKDLQSVVWQDTKTEKQIMNYAYGNIFRPLILHGPVGTGKTTIAELLPSAIEPTIQSPDIKVLNAGIDRNITAINKIFGPSKMTGGMNKSGLKVFVFDEAEGIKDDAFLALRGIMPRLQTMDILFIFTTNNLAVLPTAIKSRATCIKIDYAPPQQWLPRAQWILEEEGHPRSQEQLLPIIQAAKGDSRVILQNLQELVIQINEDDDPQGPPQGEAPSVTPCISPNVVARITPQPEPSQTTGPETT